MAKAISSIRPMTNALRARSAKVRPASTAERAIGRDRNRSMTPLDRSSVSPSAVWPAPNVEIWTIRPGSRKMMYLPSTIGGRVWPIAPPNT